MITSKNRWTRWRLRKRWKRKSEIRETHSNSSKYYRTLIHSLRRVEEVLGVLFLGLCIILHLIAISRDYPAGFSELCQKLKAREVATGFHIKLLFIYAVYIYAVYTGNVQVFVIDKSRMWLIQIYLWKKRQIWRYVLILQGWRCHLVKDKRRLVLFSCEIQHTIKSYCSWGINIRGFRELPLPTNFRHYELLTKLWIILWCSTSYQSPRKLRSTLITNHHYDNFDNPRTLTPNNKSDFTVLIWTTRSNS